MPVSRTSIAWVVLVALGAPDVGQAAAPPARPRLDQYGDSLPLHAIARLGTTRLRPSEGSMHLAFSHDGKVLASSGDGVVRLWQVADGKHTLQAGRGELRGLTRRGDKLLALRATKDGVFWYDVAAGRNAGRLSWTKPRVTILSPDGKWGAIRTFRATDQNVILVDLATGKEAGSIKGKFLSYTAAFTRDGGTLVTGDLAEMGGRIRFWNVATKALLRDLPAGRGAAYALAISDDGKTLAVGHAHMNFFFNTEETETAVTLRDAVTGKELHVLSRHGPRTDSLAFSPDGKTVAVGARGRWGAIVLYDVKTGKAIDQPIGHCSEVVAVSFRQSGREIVTVSTDWAIRVWDEAGKPRAMTGLRARGPLGLAIDPGGTQAAWVDPKGNLYVRDLTTAQDMGPLSGLDMEGAGLSFSPDGKALAVLRHYAGGSGVWIWDLARAKVIKVTASENDTRSWVAFSGDGKRFAMSDYDRSITLHDAATGRKILSFDKPGKPTDILVFSRDGRTLAASHADQTISLWEVATGKRRPVRVSHPSNHPNLHAYNPIALSPDGALLASGGVGPETTVRLWDVATGKERARLAGHAGGINTLAFSPDGKRLVSGSDDSTALVWDVTDALIGGVSRK